MLRSAPLRSKWSKMFNRCERLQVLTKIDLILENLKEKWSSKLTIARMQGTSSKGCSKVECLWESRSNLIVDLEADDDFESILEELTHEVSDQEHEELEERFNVPEPEKIHWIRVIHA